jgi:hypothetical protein
MKNTIILLLAIAPAALAADLTGSFDAGTKYEEPAVHAPANVSRMFVRTIERNKRTESIELPAAGGSGMIIWTIPAREAASGRVTTRLRTGGVAMQRRFQLEERDAAEMGISGGAGQEVLHVMAAAAPARYQLDVDMPADVPGVTIIAAEPDSAIAMSTWASPLSRQPGERVTLHAELRDGDAPIVGAHVTARLSSPNGKSFAAIALVDAGDGSYSATIADLPENVAGAWQVRFDADGAGFSRTGSGELVAERGAARLGEIRTEVIDGALRVRAAVDVVMEGAYRFDVLAADASRNAVAWGEGVRNLTTGATELALDIPLAQLGDTRVEDLFLDVRLLGLDAIGVAGRVTKEVD